MTNVVVLYCVCLTWTSRTLLTEECWVWYSLILWMWSHLDTAPCTPPAGRCWCLRSLRAPARRTARRPPGCLPAHWSRPTRSTTRSWSADLLRISHPDGKNSSGSTRGSTRSIHRYKKATSEDWSWICSTSLLLENTTMFTLAVVMSLCSCEKLRKLITRSKNECEFGKKIRERRTKNLNLSLVRKLQNE